MIEKQSKDSTKMLEELSKPYGCYGIKTVQGLSTWIDQWISNGGDQNALEGLLMIINSDTQDMAMWVEKEVWPNG